jgi:predicted GNAT family acetyltransferase
VVEADARVVATAIRTPPWNVVLSEVDEPGALGALVADLLTDHGPTELPGVTGPAEHAGEFAGLWSARTGAVTHLDIRERIFRLTRVTHPPRAPGSVRIADPAERGLLVDWMEAFHVESHGRPAPTPAATMVDGWLRRQSRTLWLWEVDRRPVSLVGIGMGTPNGFRIGPVYTPPDERGRGYASNLVATVTQSGLDAGKRFGFLFTDLANPTSNHIYQAIGYEPVRDVDMWLFGAGR